MSYKTKSIGGGRLIELAYSQFSGVAAEMNLCLERRGGLSKALMAKWARKLREAASTIEEAL